MEDRQSPETRQRRATQLTPGAPNLTAASPRAEEPLSPARSARLIPSLAPALVFWTLCAVVVGFNTYVSMLTHGHSLWRLIGFQIAASYFWVGATPLIAWLSRRFSLLPPSATAIAVHGLVATALTLGYAAWTVGMMVAIQPFSPMSPDIPSFPGFMLIRFPIGILIYLGTAGAIYAFGFYRSAARVAELERELSRAQLEALANQVQPHFLFNALHTVAGLVRANEPQKAIAMLAGLGELLRYALDGSTSQEVPLREELEVARRYLEIQGLRYGERFALEIGIAPETIEARVPRLILQPLLENGIRHGVARSAGPAWLRLQGARVNGTLRITIENGSPTAPPADPGTGLGLRTTRARLERLYGQGFSLEARQVEDRFELALEIPWRSCGTAETP